MNIFKHQAYQLYYEHILINYPFRQKYIENALTALSEIERLPSPWISKGTHV